MYAISKTNSKKDIYVTISGDQGSCYQDKLNIAMDHR